MKGKALALCAMLCMVGYVQAVDLINADWEDNSGLGKQEYTTEAEWSAIDGWTADGYADPAGRSGQEDNTSYADGFHCFGQSGGGTVFQTTTETIVVGETYALSFDAFETGNSGIVTGELYYVDGSTRVVIASSTIASSNAGEIYEIQELYSGFVATATEAGHLLGVQFSFALGWAGFDNVAIATDVDPLPPYWTEDPVSGDDAIGGRSYIGTLDGKVIDPNFDEIVYSRDSGGPAWLTVATDGTLGGTPPVVSGTNTFTVTATAGGDATDAILNIMVNIPSAPEWTDDPMTNASAFVDMVYSNTVAGLATDSEGDEITYSKDPTSPAWLTVDSDGTLWGTPTIGDVGMNMFAVIATDIDGSSPATLYINVVDGSSIISITVENFSFEDPGTVKQDLSTGNVSGWGAEAGSIGVETGTFNVTEGNWSLYAGDGAWATNLTSNAIAAGDEFQLTVDVANTWLGTEGATIELYYDDGGTLVTMGSAIYEFPEGSTSGPFEHTLSISADDTPDAIGKNIGIRLGTLNAWVGFDNVRLGLIAKPSAAVTDLTISGPLAGGAEMELSWTSENRASYSVETNINLVVGEWGTFMTGIPGTGLTITTNVPVSADQVFYQVITE